MTFRPLPVMAALCAAVGWAAMASANTISFDTVVASSPDGNVSANIAFTSLNGQLQVTITNTMTGAIKHGQGVSFLSFDVTGFSTPTGFAQLTGLTMEAPGGGNSWTLADGTALNLSGPTPITHWNFSTSSNDVMLATAGTGSPGGQPTYLILPGAGTAGNGGSLGSAHQPYFIGSTNFYLTVPGMTSGTTLTPANFSDFAVGFGTGPNVTTGIIPPLFAPPVPVPAAVWSGLGMLGALGLLRLRKRV